MPGASSSSPLFAATNMSRIGSMINSGYTAASALGGQATQSITSFLPGSVTSGGSASRPVAVPSVTASGLDTQFQTSIRPMLDACDELRGLLKDEASISLPSIVVAGPQSGGKSSVLEALSGVELPRGQNITTRCPLVLRLISTTGKDAKSTNSSSSSSSSDSYAIISTSSSTGAADAERIELSQVGAKIEAMTVKLAGNNLGVVDKCIYLAVYRPNSPELTLIDLPGLTWCPVGEQPKDIAIQIKKMIYHYITPQETVILNVMAANVDLATSESMAMSKEVDELGERTIAVVTKLDLAEKGIRNRLETGVQQLALRLGCVAVRNRSQEEVASKVSPAEARKTEDEYFRDHPELSSYYNRLSDTSSIAPFGLHLGSPNLAVLLTSVQETRIRATLPKIRLAVRELLIDNQSQLEALPQACVSAADCRLQLAQLIHRFMSSCASLCRGDHAQALHQMPSLNGGNSSTNSVGSGKKTLATNDRQFHVNPRLLELYEQYRSELAQSSSAFLTKEYATLVNDSLHENQSSCALANFMSSTVFKQLMNAELNKCKVSTRKLIDGVRSVCEKILVSLIRMTFVAYPLLAARLVQICTAWLDERQALLQQRVTETLEAEMECFTMNPAYLDTVNKVKSALYDVLYNDENADQGSAAGSVGASNGPRLNSSTKTNVAKPPVSFFATVGNAMLKTANSTNSRVVVNTAQGKQGYAFAVNDLQIIVDLDNLTLDTQQDSGVQHRSLAHPSNSLLDMQITCFAYCTLAHKRLADNVPMLARYFFVRAFNTDTGALQPGGLYVHLHRATASDGLSDKSLTEWMREDSVSAQKRQKLTLSITKLQQAMQVFEAL